uniref:Uncharacterized protein n=1 Tax=Oryza glumipatula TaxID=40148 RepID=A0A0D9YXE0_9ORYZ
MTGISSDNGGASAPKSLCMCLRPRRLMARSPVYGGLAPPACIAILRLSVFRNSRKGRRRICPNRWWQGMIVTMSPNLTFWAAHHYCGTYPLEIDFLGLGLGLRGCGCRPPRRQQGYCLMVLPR